MGKVIKLQVLSPQMEATEQSAWDAYVAAQDRAKRTLDPADGIAAGKAWGAFMALFVKP